MFCVYLSDLPIPGTQYTSFVWDSCHPKRCFIHVILGGSQRNVSDPEGHALRPLVPVTLMESEKKGTEGRQDMAERYILYVYICIYQLIHCLYKIYMYIYIYYMQQYICARKDEYKMDMFLKHNLDVDIAQ